MDGLLVDSVTLGVPGRVLLRDFALRVGAGSVLGVVGPSGSGKTQLLRAIAGLRDVDAGSFSLDGQSRDAMHMPSWRRRVTYVGQRAIMLKGSVRDNLERPLGYAAVAGKLDLPRTEAELSQLRLDVALLTQEARSLSVGEQQRIALMRAASIAPDVLLLDEPTSALDAESVEAVETWLGAQIKAGRSAVIVSHDAAQIERLAAKRVNLKDFMPEAEHAG
ncbi:MAG TPA: ATP-binding cassette domain-containing protein [Polyangiaceae bacterium]|nr:ATP-binding cassette domain-containing protein [Polyangiaceae bacterium]